MIGIDDFSDMPNHNHNASQVHIEKSPNFHISDHENGVEEMSDSSSSSSSSDSDSENEQSKTVVYKNNNSTNGHTNGLTNSNTKLPSMPTHILNEDLCLSESGSDSD